MRVEYDQVTDTLYIHFNDKAVKRTTSVNNLVQVDLDEDGRPVQIEILSASHFGDVSEFTYKILNDVVATNS